MNQRRWMIVGAAVLAVAAAIACGPDFPKAVFHFDRHPDLPRGPYVRGQLGVLQKTYARSYLVVAYRHMTGVGLNRREIQQVEDYFKDRETGWWDKSGTDWYERWLAARGAVRSVPAPERRELTGGSMQLNEDTNAFFLNCAEDAFRNAVNTLDARAGRFGRNSKAVAEWVKAQDEVFFNCDQKPARVPAPAGEDMPELIRKDREYQIAAARFYAGDSEQAIAAFRRIAADPASQWRLLSRYLVARAMIRGKDPNFGVEAGAILADPELVPIHAPTVSLVRRMGVKVASEDYFLNLSRALRSRDQADGLRDGIWNYTTIFDALLGDADPNPGWWDKPTRFADATIFEKDDMADWIYHFQSIDPASKMHAIGRWRERKSVPWLVTALMRANLGDAKKYGLIEAAMAVPAKNPAKMTLDYHVNRLLLEGGEKDRVRERVDRTLAAKLPRSAMNLFRGQRMMAAPDLREFLRFAPRRPILMTADGEQAPSQWAEDTNWFRQLGPGLVRMDRDATAVFNYALPFAMLEQVALKEELPEHWRREFALAALTRAVVLGRDAAPLAARLGELDPRVAKWTAEVKGTVAEQRFPAAFLLLHQPGAVPYVRPGLGRLTAPGAIDSYRDNWWCPLDLLTDFGDEGWPTWRESRHTPGPRAPLVAFLTNEERAAAAADLARLVKTPNGPEFLGPIVMAHAKANPQDPRVPEALHLIVRATRYPCGDVKTGQVAKAAFQLLHRRYGKTAWAAKTPIWHDNSYSMRESIEK